MEITKPDGSVLRFRSVEDCLKYQAGLDLQIGATSQEWTGQPVGSASGSPATQQAKREQEESGEDARKHGVTRAEPTPLAYENKPKGGRKMPLTPWPSRGTDDATRKRSRSRETVRGTAIKYSRNGMPGSDKGHVSNRSSPVHDITRSNVRSDSRSRNGASEHSSAPDMGRSNQGRNDLSTNSSDREKSTNDRGRTDLRLPANDCEVSRDGNHGAGLWTPTWAKTARADEPQSSAARCAPFHKEGRSEQEGTGSLLYESHPDLCTTSQQHTRPCMQGEDEGRNSIRGRDLKCISEDDSGRNSLTKLVPRSKQGGRAQHDQKSRNDFAETVRERDWSHGSRSSLSTPREVPRSKQDHTYQSSKGRSSIKETVPVRSMQGRRDQYDQKGRSDLTQAMRERDWNKRSRNALDTPRQVHRNEKGRHSQQEDKGRNDDGKRGWRVAKHQEKVRAAATSSKDARIDFYPGVAKHMTPSHTRRPAQQKAAAVTLKPREGMIDPEEQRKRDLRAQRFREVREAKNFATGQAWIANEAVGASEVSKAEEALRAVGVSSSVAPQSAKLLPASHRKRLAELGSICWSVIQSLYAYLAGIDIAREGIDRRAALKHGPARKAALEAEKSRHVQALIECGAIEDNFDGDPFAAFNAHVRKCAQIAKCEDSIAADPAEIFLAIEDAPPADSQGDSVVELEIGEAHPFDCTCDECI